MAELRIALAQTNPTVGGLAGNAERIVELIGQAHKLGAELVVFGELAVCGYPPEDLLLKKHFLQDTRRTMEKLAKDCATIPAIVGFAEMTEQGCCKEQVFHRGPPGKSITGIRISEAAARGMPEA